jgi:hypothetical protein
MSEGNVNKHVDELTIEQWLQIRKEEGPKIEPDTAEVTWNYVEILDPYGVAPPPEECQCVGRGYFARAPSSDIWVSFYDLPDETRRRLWERLESGLAFPDPLDELLEALDG